MARAAVVVEPGRLEIVEVPEPEPGPYEALVEMLSGGLCGTDRHILAKAPSTGTTTRRSSVTNRSVSSSPSATASGISKWATGCFAWPRHGRDNDSESSPRRSGVSPSGRSRDGRPRPPPDGGRTPGAEIAPYDRLQKRVDPRFDPLDAGAFIVFKETLSWLRRLADVRDRRVLVIGTGPAALAFVQVARLEGAAEILVLGRRQGPARLRTAPRCLTTPSRPKPPRLPAQVRELTGGRGIEVAIEAAGTVDVLEAVPDCLADGGILGTSTGSPTGRRRPFRWGWDRPVPRAWSLRFEQPDEAGIHDEASELVSSGRYNLKSTLTNVLPFNQIGEAVELMMRRERDRKGGGIDFRAGALPG